MGSAYCAEEQQRINAENSENANQLARENINATNRAAAVAEDVADAQRVGNWYA